MKLFNIRLLCGNEGLYQCEMELPRRPIWPSEARKLLIDAFGPDLTPEAIQVDEVNVGAFYIACSISGTPSIALIAEKN